MAIATIDFLRAFQAVVVIIGMVIIYYAVKGYRKTGSKSLLYMALGFLLVTIGAVVAGIFFEVLNYDLTSVETIQTGFSVVGFMLIVYSIIGRKD